MERIVYRIEEIEDIILKEEVTLQPKSRSFVDRLDEMHEVASKQSRMNRRPVSIGVIFSK